MGEADNQEINIFVLVSTKNSNRAINKGFYEGNPLKEKEKND